MTRDEVEATQILSVWRRLLKQRSLLKKMTGIVGDVAFVDGGFAAVAPEEFNLGAADAFVALRNIADKRLQEKIDGFRPALRLYFTDQALRDIESDIERESDGSVEGPPGPGLSNEPAPDRRVDDAIDVSPPADMGGMHEIAADAERAL